MVHTAVGYARMSDRLRAMACTTSIGPGATNMVTGAAVATTNRIPVLLLPGDVFATRRANPVLQELEDPTSLDVSVNDCLRPVSRYFDRVWRPEQLAAALLNAMRVLTDPAETGAVTLATPPGRRRPRPSTCPTGCSTTRVWRDPPPAGRGRRSSTRSPRWCARRRARWSWPAAASSTRARPRRSRASPHATGLPVAETQAGKGSLRFDHPASLGALGATGTTAANAVARDADLVIGVGTRWSDFTTASHSAFAEPRRALRQHQRDPLRHRQARRARRRRRRARRARGAWPAAWPAGGSTRGSSRAAASWRRSGTRSSRRPTPSATRRSPRPR